MQQALPIRPDSRYPNTTAGKLAAQLGWCSIALGAIELMAARQLARALGMRGQEALIRAYGVRELVKGVGILTSPNPTPWLWGRVAGDALDFGTLAFAYRSSPNRRNVALAMANVAATAAVDVLAARQLSAIARRQEQPFVDYSNRSGFPRGLEMSRGLASDFVIPPDFRTPEALRPWTSEG